MPQQNCLTGQASVCRSGGQLRDKVGGQSCMSCMPGVDPAAFILSVNRCSTPAQYKPHPFQGGSWQAPGRSRPSTGTVLRLYMAAGRLNKNAFCFELSACLVHGKALPLDFGAATQAILPGIDYLRWCLDLDTAFTLGPRRAYLNKHGLIFLDL